MKKKIARIMLLVAGLDFTAQAAVRTWNGNTDASFATTNNWSSAFASGDAMSFGAAGTSGAILNNNLASLTTVTGITFTAAAPAYTINGNVVTLTGGITSSTLADQTFNNNLTLSADQTVTVTTNGGFTFNGVIGSDGTVHNLTLSTSDKSGTAGTRPTITLAAANTYGGNTIITKSGTSYLTIKNGINDALSTAGTLEANVGSQLGIYYNLNGYNQTIAGLIGTNGPCAISGTGSILTINTAPGTDYTFDGQNHPISSSLSIVKTGDGIQRFAGKGGSSDNSYSGGTAILGGTLVGGDHGIGTGAVGITNGTLQIGTGESLEITAAINGDSTARIDLNGSVLTQTVTTTTGVFGGSITNAGRYVKAGSGTQTFSGANTFSGGTVISGGTLQVGNGGTTGSLGSGDVTNNATLVYNRSDAFTADNLISGAGTLTQSGTNALILTNANTYSGATTISAGTLVVSNALALQNSTLNYNTNGGTVKFGANSSAFTLGGLAGNQNLALTNTGGAVIALTVGNNDSDTTYSGILSAGGSLIKTGTGTLTLATNNTFSGGVTVNAGTLSITAGAQQTINSALGTGTLTLNSGATLSTGNRIITNAVVIPAGQSATITGNTALNGPLSGSGSLFHTNSGSFTLILAGDNSGFTGSITNSSTLSAGCRNALGSGTLYMKDDSGIHSMLSAEVDLLGYNAITNNIVLLNTVRLGLGGRIGDFELKGILSGDGGLIANNEKVTVTLSGANTYTNVTEIALGGLIVNGSLQSKLITAASGTTLSGTGTVQAVTMNSGSLLEIGNAVPGVMNFRGDLTLADGSTNVMKVFSTNSYDILKGAGTNTLFANGTILLDFSDDVTIENGDQFNVTPLFQNWSNVTQGAGVNFTTIGLPGSFAADVSTVTSNGMVTIVPSSAVPFVLPEQFPIAMTYHLPKGATNVSDLVKYEPVQIMGSSGNGDFGMLRNYYPNKMLLLQDAWGGAMSIGMQSAYPGHWLLKTGTKLSASCSPTDTVLHVENYSRLATSQTPVTRDLSNNNAYLLMYGLDANGQPDWSHAEHLKLTAVNTTNGTITVDRAQQGSSPQAFTSGQAVIARHMLFWYNDPGGQWQLNFSLQCPRGGPLNLTAAEWFARQIKQLIDESGADGIEFDVARWQWGSIGSNNMDCDNNLVSDYGYIDGVQSFGLGGQVFLRELRKLLGPGKIIQMDSNGAVGQQRGWKYVNGCQLESFPNANNFDTFSEAFLHLRQYRDNIETLPNFSYPYVKTPTTVFENLYDNGTNIDWHFRTGFAAALLTGMPSPFTSIADPNFDPGEFDPDATNTVDTSSGGAFYKWDEFTGGDLNDWQWLGKPLGAAVQVLDNLGSSNLLASAVWRWKVETNFTATCLTNSGEYSAVMSALASVTNILPSDTAHYTGTQVPKTLTYGTRLEMDSGAPVLVSNREYTIEFEAAGNDRWDYGGQIFEKVPRMLAILTPHDDKQLSVLISSNWAFYRLSFYVTTNTPLVFGVSEQIGDAKIRNIKLYQGGAERWTREFEHGRVYLNMTKTPWTVNVGTGVVQRLSGTLTTNVNYGATENGTLIVPSWDAVFLRTWTVDAWRSANFTADQLTNSTVSGDSADPDGDGFSNLEEYVAGTNPTNAASKFLAGGSVNRTTAIQLNWAPVSSGRVYDVYWTSNLLSSFIPLQTNIVWSQSIYTSPVPSSASSGFYKIKVRRP